MTNIWAAFALSMALPSAAGAATVTFDNLNDPNAFVYVESGVTVTGNGPLGQFSNTSLHMDDIYVSASRAVFTMAGSFNAVSFDLTPSSFDYYICDPTGNCTRPTYPNVLVQGYRGSELVSQLLFDMGASAQTYTVGLGVPFGNLTSLAIEVLPPSDLFNPPPGYYADCGFPCSHFDVDNVTLAPVPLPAGLPLAASALALLGLIARR